MTVPEPRLTHIDDGGAARMVDVSAKAETRREATEEKGRRIVREELDKLGWPEAELGARAKGDARKVGIARRLRAETAVTLKRPGGTLS